MTPWPGIIAPEGAAAGRAHGAIGGETIVEVFVGVLLIFVAIIEIVWITISVNGNIRAGR